LRIVIQAFGTIRRIIAVSAIEYTSTAGAGKTTMRRGACFDEKNAIALR
jgi:hypothetical protein